jgi:hypothetical protein
MGESAMAKTCRDVATEQMLETIEEATRRVINYWGDLPPEMKEAVEEFRIQLGAASIAWNLLEGRSGEKYTNLERRLD